MDKWDACAYPTLVDSFDICYLLCTFFHSVLEREIKLMVLVDQYLLFRIRAKQDPEAFAKIYDRYVEAIYRFSILKLPRVEDAQDVTSETFTRAWQYLIEHHDVENIRALLYRIARNLIADKYRETQTVSLDAVTMQHGLPSTLVKASDVGDQNRERGLIEARADLALIVGRLDRLKEDFRDVLTLRLIDGLSFDLIADIMEKKPGAVRVIYHRAMKALKEIEKS